MHAERPLLSGLLSLLVALFAFLLAVQQVYNYDIWWHLKTGQWIWQHKEIPHTDPFTIATANAPWQPHYWLSDVLFALLLSLAGINGLILFKALVIALAFLLAFHLMLRQGVNPFLASALVLLAVPLAQFRFLLRPHIFMFLLSALFFWRLSVGSSAQKWYLLWLLPLMALWVNLHASFFLGLVLAGCFCTESLLQTLYPRYSREHRLPSPAFLGPLLLLLAAITLLNPFGLDLLRWILTDFILKQVTQGTITIEEHAPLVWGEHPGFWGLMLATATSFLLAWRRVRFFHLLVFLATSFLALRGVRFIAVATLLQVPLLGYNLQAMFDKLPAKIYRPSFRLQAALALPLLLIGSLFLFQQAFAEHKVYRFGLGIQESRFPKAAVAFLRRLDPAGNFYNTWALGGYLLWEWPERKVFWDGRSLEAQRRLAEQLEATSHLALGPLLQRFDIRAAILSLKDRHMAAYFRHAPAFRLAYFDDQALIFLADNALPPEKRETVRFFEHILPESPDFSYLASYAHSPVALRVEEELRHAVRLAPQSFRTHFLLGFFLEVTGRRGEALDQYFAAMQANPRLAFIHYDLGHRAGRLAIRLQQWDRAARLLREALRFQESSEFLFLLATALYQGGHTEEAEQTYQEVLRREPQQVASLVNLGYLYLDTGRFQKAEEMQRQALEAAPTNEAALFGLALALQRGGKREEAIQRWQEFLAKHPQSRWEQKARAYLAQLTAAQPATR
ncbi:MAG: hypothetical protein D6736_16685 [Nitrospinota bacterium]|nr:MAG: hypothetical protein D6736_16685 [Nitrospinota bacterium]